MGTVAGIGAATILVFYIVVGGRAYCSWVCPINVVTDLGLLVEKQAWIEPELATKKKYQALVIGHDPGGICFNYQYCLGSRKPYYDAAARTGFWYGCCLGNRACCVSI